MGYTWAEPEQPGLRAPQAPEELVELGSRQSWTRHGADWARAGSRSWAQLTSALGTHWDGMAPAPPACGLPILGHVQGLGR